MEFTKDVKLSTDVASDDSTDTTDIDKLIDNFGTTEKKSEFSTKSSDKDDDVDIDQLIETKSSEPSENTLLDEPDLSTNEDEDDDIIVIDGGA